MYDYQRKLAANRAWRARNRERYNAYARSRRREKADHVNAVRAQWRAANGGKIRAQKRALYAANAAVERERARIRYAVGRVLAGKMYTPMPFLRLPSWAPVGKCYTDPRSPFLIENRTVAQDEYARELAIERRAQA